MILSSVSSCATQPRRVMLSTSTWNVIPVLILRIHARILHLSLIISVLCGEPKSIRQLLPIKGSGAINST